MILAMAAATKPIPAPISDVMKKDPARSSARPVTRGESVAPMNPALLKIAVLLTLGANVLFPLQDALTKRMITLMSGLIVVMVEHGRGRLGRPGRGAKVGPMAGRVQ